MRNSYSLHLRKKLRVFFLLSIIMLSVLLPGTVFSASSEELPVEAEHAILIEAETGRILYEKNTGEKAYPASLTKIMTLIVAMEALEEGLVDWEDEITVSENAWRTRGSQMYLEHNQRITFRELIKGIAIISANDACVAVAEHIYGSENVFVNRMNQKASELGLENTNFVNTSGLHEEEHYTTAKDISIMALHLIQNYPEATSYQAETSFTFNDIKQYNRNPLLESFKGTDGVKTGRTGESGYSLAASTQRDGLRFISVVMKNESNEEREQDSKILLNHAFNNYGLYSIKEKGEILERVPVKQGVENTVPVKPKGELVVVLSGPEKDRVSTEVTFNEELSAPVKEGEIVGEVKVELDGEVLAQAELVTGDSVEELGFFASVWDSMKNFFIGLAQMAWEGITGIFG